MQQKTVEEAIHYRRSVRIYDPEKNIDTAIVKKCIQQASLAPNSSNMQLWEFYLSILRSRLEQDTAR